MIINVCTQVNTIVKPKVQGLKSVNNRKCSTLLSGSKQSTSSPSAPSTKGGKKLLPQFVPGKSRYLFSPAALVAIVVISSVMIRKPYSMRDVLKKPGSVQVV